MRQYLIAIYAVTCAAFFAIAFAIELPGKFLPLAISAEILAISLLNRHLFKMSNVAVSNAMCIAASLLAIAFCVMLIPDIIKAINALIINASRSMGHHLSATKLRNIMPESAHHPILHIGLPGIFFAISTYFLRSISFAKKEKIVGLFEVISTCLLVSAIYCLIKKAFHNDINYLAMPDNFIESGIITNAIFIYGFACIWLGENYNTIVLSKIGRYMTSYAMFNIAFALLIDNPLWSKQEVGEIFIINGLLINYLIPIYWIFCARSAFLKDGRVTISNFLYALMIALAFAFVALNIRQIFHGNIIHYAKPASNGEIYLYSVSGILFGIVLLAIGTIYHDIKTRIVSLAFVILTCIKVFLYDMAELTGLLRVFSFFALGISLLCISWFYTKFVIKANAPNNV